MDIKLNRTEIDMAIRIFLALKGLKSDDDITLNVSKGSYVNHILIKNVKPANFDLNKIQEKARTFQSK